MAGGESAYSLDIRFVGRQAHLVLTYTTTPIKD